MTPIAAVNGATGMFGTTLNASEVAAFKSTVDSFATNYTSGADSAKDGSAATALKSGLSDVALSVWSRTNIASPSAVAQFKTATDTFASSYTAGTNPAQDMAAWKSLQSAMNSLGGSLAGTASSSPMDASIPGIYRLSSIPDPSNGDVLGLTSMGTLSAGDLASVKTAVDKFATDYTSGSDATKDQAADLALQTKLGEVSMKYWQAMSMTTNANPIAANGMLPMATMRSTLPQNLATTTATGAPNGLG